MDDRAFQTIFYSLFKRNSKGCPLFSIFIILANEILSICIFYIFAKGLKEYFSFCKRNGGGFSFDKLLQFHFRREEQSVCLIKSEDITFLKRSNLNFCVCNHCLNFYTNCLNTVFRLTSGISSGTLPIHDRSLMLQKQSQHLNPAFCGQSFLSLCWLTFIINLN